MTPKITNLSRFPVKGLSAETLQSVDLREGFGFPGDRTYAIALPKNDFIEESPEPKRKSEFLMLARFPVLARLNVEFDHESRELTIHSGHNSITQNMDSKKGREALADYFGQFAPADEPLPRVVHGENEHRFTDVGTHSTAMMHSVSLINLSSVRELEQEVGEKLDMRRFRSNIVVDGLPSWTEQSFVGNDISIGGVRFRGAWPTSRCPATQANPDTGERDVNVPKALKSAYGHQNFGVYLYTCGAGRISVGDPIEFDVPSDFRPHSIYLSDLTGSKSSEEKAEEMAFSKRVMDLMVDHALPDKDAQLIASDPAMTSFFREVVALCQNPKLAVIWVTNELVARLKRSNLPLSDCPISATQLGVLCNAIEEKTVTGKVAKDIFDELWNDGGDVREIIESRNLQKVSDPKIIADICMKLISENSENAAIFRSGKVSLLGWFVGQVMKETNGMADPTAVKGVLISLLEAEN